MEAKKTSVLTSYIQPPPNALATPHRNLSNMHFDRHILGSISSLPFDADVVGDLGRAVGAGES
jgi:hypothetical protein